MSKVYIEHDDRHNEPILMTFESQEEAMKYVMRYAYGDKEDVEVELFDELIGCGEYSAGGGDRFIVITEDHARERSEYWDSVAEAIRAGQKAP